MEIQFNTRHALPLRAERFHVREVSAVNPHNRHAMTHSWPQTRPFHVREQSQYSPRTQTFHVRAQSASAFSPRPQTWPRTVRMRDHATASIVRDHVLAMATRCPHTVRGLELSMSAISPLSDLDPASGRTNECPRRRLMVSTFRPASFLVRIRICPPYVRIYMLIRRLCCEPI